MKKEFDLGLFPKGDEMIGRLEGYTDYRRYFMYKLSRHIPDGEYVSIIANVKKTIDYKGDVLYSVLYELTPYSQMVLSYYEKLPKRYKSVRYHYSKTYSVGSEECKAFAKEMFLILTNGKKQRLSTEDLIDVVEVVNVCNQKNMVNFTHRRPMFYNDLNINKRTKSLLLQSLSKKGA